MHMVNIISQIRSLDQFLFHQINNLAGRYLWLDALGIFLADYLQYFVIVAVLWIFWKQWRVYLEIILAIILSRLAIGETIRVLFGRLRPFMTNHIYRLLYNETSVSFPSGHALAFFALAMVAYLYNKKAGLWFFAAVFLIVLGRIFCGVHYPLDVLAGFLIGIFSGWLIYPVRKLF